MPHIIFVGANELVPVLMEIGTEPVRFAILVVASKNISGPFTAGVEDVGPLAVNFAPAVPADLQIAV